MSPGGTEPSRKPNAVRTLQFTTPAACSTGMKICYKYDNMVGAPVRSQTALVSQVLLNGVRVASQVHRCDLQAERSRQEDVYSPFMPLSYMILMVDS